MSITRTRRPRGRSWKVVFSFLHLDVVSRKEISCTCLLPFRVSGKLEKQVVTSHPAGVTSEEKSRYGMYLPKIGSPLVPESLEEEGTSTPPYGRPDVKYTSPKHQTSSTHIKQIC